MSPPSRSVPLYNRPGLPALAYRVTTYSDSRRRLLDRIGSYSLLSGDRAGSRPLAQLTTRDSDDPVVAILDGWAAAVDVLTFYQERIANEGYLRTCTERRSLLELGRGMGYELQAGVAASTYLAFAIEDAEGAPSRISLPVGTRVQSVPGQDEEPQIFETLEAIEARAEWNELLPLLAQKQLLSLTKNNASVTTLYLQGQNLNLRTGDLLCLGGSTTAYVARLLPDPITGNTRVELAGTPGLYLQTPPLLPLLQPPEVSRVYTSDDVTGVDPLLPLLQPPEVGWLGQPLTAGNIEACILGRTWEEGQLAAFLTDQGWDAAELTRLAATTLAANAAQAGSSLDVKVYRQRVGFLGSYAQPWSSLPKLDPTYSQGPNPYANATSSWDLPTARTIWLDSWGTLYKTGLNQPVDFFLERSVPEIVSGSSVLVIGRDKTAEYSIQSAVDAMVAGYGQVIRATGLVLQSGAPQDLAAAIADPFVTRSSVAYVQSEVLPIAAMVPQVGDCPVTDRVTLDRLVLGLAPGRKVLVSGERYGAPGVVKSEVATLGQILHESGRTKLVFSAPLQETYQLRSLRLNANLALAGHGETVADEILGSGDSSQPNQSFPLRRGPLTYLRSASSGTPQSTLTLRVQGIQWQEVPSLYGLDGRSPGFMLRTTEDGTTQVLFGDGEHGARLPTGVDNVVVSYRIGSGPVGEVPAGSLQLPLTRPLGLRSVGNPLPATGSAAAEALDQARENAPLQVATLDRVVALADYQAFAAAFPGIAKAQARSVSLAGRPVLQLTLAADGGKPLPDTTGAALQSALAAVGDPGQGVVLNDFRPATFQFTATVTVAVQHQPALVLAAVEQALKGAFGFARRDFDQPVALSEVVLVAQQVPGVTAVTEYTLQPPPDEGLQELQPLPAQCNDADSSRWVGAQIVLLATTSLKSTVAK